jgi:hypothetical protein
MNILSLLLFPERLVPAINDARPSGEVRVIGALNETMTLEGDWIRLAPYGEHANKVGVQVFDRAAADAMVKAFNSVETRLATMFRGLPIYEGHPDDPEWRRQNPSIKTAAVGRVKKLEAREDGAWAQVAWNERGEGLVRGPAPAYTAQSPHWGMLPIPSRKKAFSPVELFSIGLTNQPNISGTHLGLNEVDTSNPMKELLIKLLAAVGVTVAADATDEAISAAATDAIQKAGAAKTSAEGASQATADLAAAKNQLESLQTQLTAATNESATLKASIATERRERATLVVVSAINEGRLTEAQRAATIDELVAAPDFSAKASEIAKKKSAINTTNKLGNLGARRAEGAASEAKITAINTAVSAYIAEHKLDAARDYDRAFTAVKSAKPELFAASNG